MTPRLHIPQAVRQTAQQVFGEPGQQWLAALPRLVAEEADRWGLTLGEPYTGGSVALVLAVTQADGVPAVLKCSPPFDPESRHEADALRLYGGSGAVRLYDHNPANGTLLLEKITPGLALADHPDRNEAIRIACQLLKRLWQPVATDHPFQTVFDVASAWRQQMLAAQRPDTDTVVGSLLHAASAILQDLLRSDDETVLVNRDVHLGNILAARREDWLLIDPKPLVGSPAFDTGYLLLDLLGPTPTAKQNEYLTQVIADYTSVDPGLVRGWALVRAVENVLWDLGRGGSGQPYFSQALVLSQ